MVKVIDPEKYKISYPGRTEYYLNPDLCKKQKITKKGLKRLKELHMELQALFAQMEASSDPVELKKLNEKFVLIQFDLQTAWGFEQDPDLHPWTSVPKCQCPKMDNAERRGTPWRIINGSCPVHGA